MKQASELSDWELQLAIAEHRGYKILCNSTYTLDEWEIRFPDGDSMQVIEPDEPGNHIPNYTTDMNAATELLKHTVGAALAWGGTFPRWYVLDKDEFVITEHTNPARAISEAYYTLHIYQPKAEQ